MRDASLRIRRRVVVQNLPAISALLKNERKRPARGHGIPAQQLEARGAEGETGCERADAHLLERERVTRLAGGEVRVLVAVEQLLPAVHDVAGGDVARERVVRVVAHEAGEVAPVPIGRAAREQRRDLALRVSGWGGGTGRQYDHAPETAHRAPPHAAP